VLFIAISAMPIANGADPDQTLCEADDLTSYSTSLHIGAVFIVMAVSGAGIAGTLLLGMRKRQSTVVARALQLLKMFGIGVIASTAWVHLLPDAFEQFSNPCLDKSWQSYSPNWVGVFAMLAGFIVQLIEITAFGHAHHKKEADAHSHLEAERRRNSLLVEDNLAIEQAIPAGHGTPLQLESHFHEDGQGLSTIILEAGILFHSLIIGLTLGITSDEDGFRTLLTAVCFHQMFEGMALGSLISNLKHNRSCLTLVFLGLVYPLTTPVGMIIGIGVRNVYNAHSNNVIVAQGILDSLSAGILIYNAYAELISVEVNHNRTFRKFSSKFKAACFLSMYLGASAMAVVAVWA